MRAYLEDLIERLADQAPTTSSAQSVSFAAHREAEQLTDASIVDELAEAVRRLKPAQRSGCYFIIGKVGRNSGEERCAAILLDLLPSETSKYNLASLLDGVAGVPKGPRFDLSPVYPLLDDKRWLVRHAAIRALDNSASPDAEVRLLSHLASTVDQYDMTYCHAVLSRIGTIRALPAIEPNLMSKKRDVRDSARWAVDAIRKREPDAQPR